MFRALWRKELSHGFVLPMKARFLLLLPLLVFSFSSCTLQDQVELMEREQRRVRSESLDLRNENLALRKDVENFRSNLADTRASLQEIQSDLSSIKAKLDEVRYTTDRQIGQSTKQGEQRIRDLEGKVGKLEEDLKAQANVLKQREQELASLQSSKAPGKESSGDSGQKASEAESARKDYEDALRLIERKDFRTAIGRFKEFINKYPSSDFSDNAQYWIGESHYALKEYDQAILEFDAVKRKYPSGDKVPAALLRQGFAFAELGDKVDARLILQELVERFPQSPEAGKARQKLKTIKS